MEHVKKNHIDKWNIIHDTAKLPYYTHLSFEYGIKILH